MLYVIKSDGISFPQGHSKMSHTDLYSFITYYKDEAYNSTYVNFKLLLIGRFHIARSCVDLHVSLCKTSCSNSIDLLKIDASH